MKRTCSILLFGFLLLIFQACESDPEELTLETQELILETNDTDQEPICPAYRGETNPSPGNIYTYEIVPISSDQELFNIVWSVQPNSGMEIISGQDTAIIEVSFASDFVSGELTFEVNDICKGKLLIGS